VITSLTREPGMVPYGFCGFKRRGHPVCKERFNHHRLSVVGGTVWSPVVEDHEFVPTYYLPDPIERGWA
jgi:hypothetical protein